ncbi:MAG: CCA tRNA nucleotidyltransferase [Acidobacteriota bacterium]|nr:CCA tRNA nucleotidyltransferase [Acidobacteriota bacterium]
MLKRLRNLLGRRGAASPTNTATTDTQTDDPVVSGERPPVHRGPNVVHNPIPLADIDPDAVKILRRLTRFNHTAYLVGGCVRDLLLERKPKDFDIGTTATPRQIKRLFSNCRIIGKRFRLAHIYFQNGKILEVATFRARDIDEEGDAGGGEQDLLIRDDNIFGTPEEDAIRRDFTINQLFYDVNQGNVLDHADGLRDLRRGLVRMIGDPEIRFREDPIRILRAIRFAARLDFSIETETLAALEKTRNLIPKAAAPRIMEEINRFCRGGAAAASFRLLRDTGVFEVILPEFAEGYEEDPSAWKFLLLLLESMDRRTAVGRDVGTGEILAVLVLPLLSRRIGWKEDGVVQKRDGVSVRDLADEILRPMALRLRMPRRDQETCRQMLMTLHRMVPTRRLRRATRESILRRPVTPSCLWVLETVAKRAGGDFSSAFDTWQAAGADSPPAPRQRGGKTADRQAEPGKGSTSRRRRRRSPRQRGDRQSEPAKPPRKEHMPPPWDDGYFFAALPTVPELAGDDDAHDRYGAKPAAGDQRAKQARASTERTKEGPTTDDDEAPRPRKRRRRRRRSRSRREGGGSSGAGEPAAS